MTNLRTPSSPIIQIQSVSKSFPGALALDDVSIDISPGEFHSIVGENGAGKSTLMKILSGVITEYEGTILLRDEPIQFRGTKDAENQGVSIIHQELNLVNELTAAANIFLGRELRTKLGFLDNRRMEQEAEQLFRQLECDLDPRQLVQGMRVGDQQLVEIAKALSLQSEILIMDEPTSALTETEVERLFRVIEQLLSQGVTILYISHKMDEIFRLSDQISILRDGNLVNTLVAKKTAPRIVTHLMVGRELKHSLETRKKHQRQEVLLEVEHLSLLWKNHTAKWRLQDVSFQLYQGEVLGLAGLMGAGRTELLECLFGTADPAPTGTIRLQGTSVNFRHPAEAMKAGLALVTEDRKQLGLFSHFNVRENITICSLNDMKDGLLISEMDERKQALHAIKLLNIKTQQMDSVVTSLSGGNQQKCIIARWLKTKPVILLLDDPTRGIDVGAKAEIAELIDNLCQEGIGIIVTSSELPELMSICDRIVVLCEGRLTGEFSRDEFSESRIMEAATLQINKRSTETSSV